MFGIGKNKTPQTETIQAETLLAETPQVETIQAEKLSITELVSIHELAVADTKAKEEIWRHAYRAHRDAIANLSHLDAAIVNSDATLQRIRALKDSADTSWIAYWQADMASNTTLAAISA